MIFDGVWSIRLRTSEFGRLRVKRAPSGPGPEFVPPPGLAPICPASDLRAAPQDGRKRARAAAAYQRARRAAVGRDRPFLRALHRGDRWRRALPARPRNTPTDRSAPNAGCTAPDEQSGRAEHERSRAYGQNELDACRSNARPRDADCAYGQTQSLTLPGQSPPFGCRRCHGAGEPGARGRSPRRARCAGPAQPPGRAPPSRRTRPRP